MNTFKIACIVFSACLSGAISARADNLVIWSPEKVSDHSYKATVGFRLPLEWEPSAGADVALASTKGGTLLPDSEQATLWGRITRVSKNPAGQSQQDLSVRLDTLRGNGSLAVSRSRNFILSDSLDMQTTRSVSLDYDGADAGSAAVTATQALTLSQPWTGTSLSAGGSVSDMSGNFSSSVALNQQILPNLDFNASVTDPLSSSQASNLNLNYRVSW